MSTKEKATSIIIGLILGIFLTLVMTIVKADYVPTQVEIQQETTTTTIPEQQGQVGCFQFCEVKEARFCNEPISQTECGLVYQEGSEKYYEN